MNYKNLTVLNNYRNISYTVSDSLNQLHPAIAEEYLAYFGEGYPNFSFTIFHRSGNETAQEKIDKIQVKLDKFLENFIVLNKKINYEYNIITDNNSSVYHLDDIPEMVNSKNRINDIVIVYFLRLKNSFDNVILAASLGETVRIVYLSDNESNKELLEAFKADIQQDIEVVKTKSKGIYLIRSNTSGLSKKYVEVKKKDDFSYDNYNEDFEKISKNIISSIDENRNGLILLHGEMGTGKTSYIRHLVDVIKKQVNYIPPDMANGLADPNFTDFLIDNLSNSVLIIEDADNVLKPRDAGGNQAVSNILNIGDGFLQDAVNATIICTFNCGLNMIDQALLRPGRLIARYEFKKLNLNKTNGLLSKLYGKYDSAKELSLAEVYNYETMPSESEVPVKNNFGFL